MNKLVPVACKCGRIPTVVDGSENPHIQGTIGVCYCLNCDKDTPICKDRQEAIQKWNERQASPPAIAQTAESDELDPVIVALTMAHNIAHERGEYGDSGIYQKAIWIQQARAASSVEREQLLMEAATILHAVNADVSTSKDLAGLSARWLNRAIKSQPSQRLSKVKE